MRFAPITAAALLAALLPAAEVQAFDVQNGGGQAGGTPNLLADPSAAPAVSLDDDLRAQLGIANTAKDKEEAAKSTFQFSGDVFGGKQLNQSALGYNEAPWVLPRTKPGQ